MIIVKKAKIPNVMITDCQKYYDGSIVIGQDLMTKYHIQAGEQVHVLGVDNPQRAITYAIPGNDGEVCCNGGMALVFNVGDIVNIITYEIV